MAVTGVPTRLSPAMSLYLDLLRLLASLAVFAGHAKVMLFAASRFGPLFGQSREAVAIFFVLSGFTMRFVSVTKERNWRNYAVARVSRLYSVVLLAILATWGFDRLGSGWNPHYYASLDFFRQESLGAALRYLSFTNELWTMHAVFGTDEPYWSLGFEVPYYLLFGIAVFTQGALRGLLLILFFGACGLKVTAYFPLWLIGVAAYEAQTRWMPKWPRWQLLAAYAATFAAYAALWVVLAKSTGSIYEHYSWSMTLWSLLYFYLVGLLVAFNMVLFGRLTASWGGPGGTVARLLRWCAGASFTLYLLHQPVLVFLSSVMPYRHVPTSVGKVVCCVSTLAIVLVFAELGERRKKWFSRWIWLALSRGSAQAQSS